MIEFRILGQFAVVRDNTPISVRGAKERAALAILLLNAGHLVSADLLIEALWESEAPASARNSLHVRIATLRKTLGSDRIETRPTGYVIHVEPGELDLERFEHLILRGRGEDLRKALALWSGSPLADFARERWATSAIARLQEMRLLALERLADLDLELGRHAERADHRDRTSQALMESTWPSRPQGQRRIGIVKLSVKHPLPVSERYGLETTG